MLLKIVTHSICSSTKRECQMTETFEDELTIQEVVDKIIANTDRHEIYNIPEVVTIITHNGNNVDVTVITKIS